MFNAASIEELHRLESLSAPIAEMLVGYQYPRWANRLPPANFFREPALRHIPDSWYRDFKPTSFKKIHRDPSSISGTVSAQKLFVRLFKGQKVDG